MNFVVFLPLFFVALWACAFAIRIYSPFEREMPLYLLLKSLIPPSSSEESKLELRLWRVAAECALDSKVHFVQQMKAALRAHLKAQNSARLVDIAHSEPLCTMFNYAFCAWLAGIVHWYVLRKDVPIVDNPFFGVNVGQFVEVEDFFSFFVGCLESRESDTLKRSHEVALRKAFDHLEPMYMGLLRVLYLCERRFLRDCVQRDTATFTPMLFLKEILRVIPFYSLSHSRLFQLVASYEQLEEDFARTYATVFTVDPLFVLRIQQRTTLVIYALYASHKSVLLVDSFFPGEASKNDHRCAVCDMKFGSRVLFVGTSLAPLHPLCPNFPFEMNARVERYFLRLLKICFAHLIARKVQKISWSIEKNESMQLLQYTAKNCIAITLSNYSVISEALESHVNDYPKLFCSSIFSRMQQFLSLLSAKLSGEMVFKLASIARICDYSLYFDHIILQSGSAHYKLIARIPAIKSQNMSALLRLFEMSVDKYLEAYGDFLLQFSPLLPSLGFYLFSIIVYAMCKSCLYSEKKTKRFLDEFSTAIHALFLQPDSMQASRHYAAVVRSSNIVANLHLFQECCFILLKSVLARGAEFVADVTKLVSKPDALEKIFALLISMYNSYGVPMKAAS